MERENLPPITEFDMLTTPNSTLIIKALIPFLDVPSQKHISIMVRMYELMQTMNYYNAPLHTLSSASMSHSNHSMEDIISTVIRYCPPESAEMIHNIRNVMQMSNAFKMYGNMEQNADFQNIFNMMKDYTNSSPGEESNIHTDHTSENKSSSQNDSEYSTPDISQVRNFMNDEQKSQYEEYLNQLNNLNL